MKTILNYKHYFYLFLAFLGGGITFYFALLGINNNGKFNSIDFILSTWIDDYYAKSITFDFWTGTIAGTFFILIEGIRLKIKRLWFFLILTIFVAYAFGFPLFYISENLN